MTKEKTMRKLRQKILFEDVMDWTIDKHSGMTHCAIEAFHLFYNGSTTGMESCFDDLPDSFYEQPPGGSYGKFSDSKWGEAWGYLFGITSEPIAYVMKNSRVGPYDNFTPGLPQDVDEFGYPEDK